MVHREGVSVREAARLLRISRNTAARRLPDDVMEPGPGRVWEAAISSRDRERPFQALEVATLFALRGGWEPRTTARPALACTATHTTTRPISIDLDGCSIEVVYKLLAAPTALITDTPFSLTEGGAFATSAPRCRRERGPSSIVGNYP